MNFAAGILPNSPFVAAMVVLILVLVALQRRQPRIHIGAWLIGLSFVVLGQMLGFLMTTPATYPTGHLLHLVADTLAGMVFLLYTGRPLAWSLHRGSLPLANAVPFVMLDILYAQGMTTPRPYVLCAACAVVLAGIIGLRLRQKWTTPLSLSIAWAIIAAFALSHDYRAATYWGLGYLYADAAMNLWRRLRPGSLGRLVTVSSLGIWSLSFFIHPWIFNNPTFGPMAENIWTMQKFFLTLGMLLVLLEDKASESDHLAHHDELTGLANRRFIRRQIQQSVEDGHVSVILLDLNGFKAVNDTHGHLAGDYLLRLVAERLKQQLRPGDHLARLGGDEFVIVTRHDAASLALEIKAAIAQPAEIMPGSTVSVRASLGISRFPDDAAWGSPAEIVSQLLRLADQRMYNNKPAQLAAQHHKAQEDLSAAR